MAQKLNIKQQDAKVLAAGYPSWFRIVEILSILTFWVLVASIVWFKVRPRFDDSPWLVLAGFMFGFIAADFVSGFVNPAHHMGKALGPRIPGARPRCRCWASRCSVRSGSTTSTRSR